MKNLLFYTFHRQLDEIYYSSLFFNKSDFLKSNFEVILHCNNVKMSYETIKNLAKFETNVKIIITSKNTGYSYGGIEATSDSFELFYEYENVIQLHPDCYIIDSKKLKNMILNTKYDVAVAKFNHIGRPSYTTDFFCFKPKYNFLKNCHKHWQEHPTAVPEHYFYDCLKESNLNVYEFNRYPNGDGAGYRNIDEFDLWHVHDNNKVKAYLNV